MITEDQGMLLDCGKKRIKGPLFIYLPHQDFTGQPSTSKPKLPRIIQYDTLVSFVHRLAFELLLNVTQRINKTLCKKPHE